MITSYGRMLRAAHVQLQEMDEPGVREAAEDIAADLHHMRVVPMSLNWRHTYVRVNWWCPETGHEYFSTYRLEPAVAYWVHLDEILSAMVLIHEPPSKG